MAGQWFSISILMFCVNTFLYVSAASSGACLFDGDMLCQTINSNYDQSNFLNDSSLSGLNTSNAVTLPEQRTAQEGAETGTVLFLLDSLNIVYDGIATFFNFAFAPLSLFKIQGMPYIISFLLAPVLTIAFWLSIIQLIRGAT